MSSVARHLVRLAGAQVLGTAFVSLQAAGFLHEKDKKKQFITRLVVSAAVGVVPGDGGVAGVVRGSVRQCAVLCISGRGDGDRVKSAVLKNISFKSQSWNSCEFQVYM